MKFIYVKKGVCTVYGGGGLHMYDCSVSYIIFFC